MTRKHFKALAEKLKENRPCESWSGNKLTQWNLCVKAVASACNQYNPNFNFEKFYTACGELFQKDGYIY